MQRKHSVWAAGLWLAATLLAAALLLGALPGLAAQAEAPPLPVDDYWRKVADTRALLDGLAGFEPLEQQAALAPVAADWEAITAVELTSGAVVPVDHQFLAARLRAPTPNLAQLDSLLAALETAHAGWPKPVHGASALTSLDAILARAEFAWPVEQPSPLAELWDRLTAGFRRWLARLLPAGGALTLQTRWLGYAFTAVCLLALALVLAYMLRGLARDVVDEAELHTAAGADEESLTAERALQQARQHSTQGDYRTAVRYLYLSSLLLLIERGLLLPDRSLTNREHLRRVADRPELARPLREVVEVFDRVWYGYQPLDAADYQRYANRVAELHQQK